MNKESELPSLKFGQYEIKYPIFQGGMSVAISGAQLAAEVARCGGAGTIGGVGRGFTPEKYTYEAGRQALRNELKKANEINPHGVFGVNLLVAVRDYDQLVRVSVENGAKFIVSGAGLPTDLPELTADHPEVALIPIVSSVQAVRIICQMWNKRHKRLPDAIVIEAPSTAGGHLGVTPKQGIYDENLKLEYVIPESRKFLESQGWNIPLIGAGGIWSREDIEWAIKLGANGVQMATRFVCTPECEAPDEFKQKYIVSKPKDIIIIQSPVGIPGRAIRTKFLERVENGEIHDQCRVSCLSKCSLRDNRQTYCIIKALDSVRRGDVENGIVFSGSNAYRSKEQGIVPVRKIFEELTG